jgi:hypothetical protein
MSDILKEMSEGIFQRDERKEAVRLVSKWERTGLLEGLPKSRKATMARLLENQAAQLLTEASTTSDITGFQNVAFPIVRRVFAGLIANELVSVQPMSLPSGLLFYLDYRFDTKKAGDQLDRATDFAAGGSLFGDQTAPGTENLGYGGFYNLGSSFSQREKITTGTYAFSASQATAADLGFDPDIVPPGYSGTQVVAGYTVINVAGAFPLSGDRANALVGKNELKQWVPVDISSVSAFTNNTGSLTANGVLAQDGTPVQLSGSTVYRRFTVANANGTDIKFVVSSSVATFTGSSPASTGTCKLSFIVGSQLNQVTGTDGKAAGTLTLDAYESDMGIGPTPPIPELDFTIKSVAVTANSRKLKAKWTPELAQDLAAYQNLDAEVELTQVLSEAIALEIDREILGDLLYNATGANFYWSRVPGRFVRKDTGADVGTIGAGPSFTGTVREWYETLIETIIDVANNIHRKTLRGAANFCVTSPDVATILEASVLYKPVLSMDPKETMFTVGTEKVGTLNNRFTIYKDPYFPRNKILVGYKGGSFLETGYVYAPYVPLIVTPTIYAPEDFTPRKGVMTRYAKKLVRSDFYGTVTVMDLNVI